MSFASGKMKVQISCAITVQLISSFILATWIVQLLFIINKKNYASRNCLTVQISSSNFVRNSEVRLS